MSRPPRFKLGYDSTPVPRRALVAVRDGRLSADEYLLLAWLYYRANWSALAERRPTPTVTLAQMVAGVRHRGPDDTLYQRLRRLSDKPERWLTYERDGRDRYIVTLDPDDVSEACRRSEEPTRPRSDTPQPGTGTGEAGARADPGRSSPTGGVADAVGGSPLAVGGHDSSQTGTGEPLEDVAETGAVGVPQTLSENKPLYEESSSTRAREEALAQDMRDGNAFLAAIDRVTRLPDRRDELLANERAVIDALNQHFPHGSMWSDE